MPEFDNNLRGVLFKNDKKETDKSPDYRGNCEIGGQEYWVSAWVKQGKSGKFLSLSFTEKNDKPKKESKKAEKVVEEDEDLPF